MCQEDMRRQRKKNVARTLDGTERSVYAPTMKTTWNEWQAWRRRGRRIIKYRDAGLGWAEIGKKLGLSRQRVYQIWQAIERGSGPYGGLL